MLRTILTAVAAALLLGYGQAAAERLELTLPEAIGIALRENLSLAESDLLLKIAGAEEEASLGDFDPSLSARVNDSYRKGQTAATFLSAEEDVMSYEVGVGGKVRSGASYGLKWSVERTKVGESPELAPFILLNPYYTSEFTLSVSQPVLKGLGRSVQESGVRVARNNVEAAELAAGHEAARVAFDTVSAYWGLYLARYDKEVAELSLRLALSTLEEVRAKIEAGSLASVEIYKAEAEAASRQERLLEARKALRDAEDRLRSVMDYTDWGVEIVPVQSPPEPEPSPEEGALVEAALENRRDYAQALKDLDSRRIMREFYRNQKLPSLDVSASAGLNGLDGGFGDVMDASTSGDFYSWQVGLEFSMPLNNRAARGNYLKAEYEERRAALRLSRLRKEITLEVREALRAVELARESVEATRKTRIASEKRLEAEQERFRLGLATLNDVLTFQEEYAGSLSSEKRSLTDYATAVVGLRKAAGTLLEGLETVPGRISEKSSEQE
ncbi:MAG: hypothetical protein Kow0025_08810 [Thermodesulfovibrionales bacterium]